MIEREFVKEKTKFMKIREFLEKKAPISAGISNITIERTPLGERISITAIKPGLIIGRAGKTVTEMTSHLKTNFKLENPQIEVKETLQPNLHATVIAKRIAATLERFGPSRFKALGYRSLQNIMRAGAMGVEIRIGGRGVPGAKARSWRFYKGYLKKCGSVADYLVDKAQARANLKSGTVGVKVSIMQPNTPLPDRVIYKATLEETQPENKVEVVEPKKEEKPKEKKPVKKPVAKKVVKKATKKAPAKKKTTTKPRQGPQSEAKKKTATKKTTTKKTAAKKKEKK
jgi:small subunit ribosomal protein S3